MHSAGFDLTKYALYLDELGSMQASEQIGALRVMGSDPIARLVAPRVLASVVMLPAMTMVANLVGIFSGYVGAFFSLDMGPKAFLDKAMGSLEVMDIACSLTKALFFGLLIALIATYMGLRADRSTEAVGRATTRTMVAGVLGILLADFVLTKVFLPFSE